MSSGTENNESGVLLQTRRRIKWTDEMNTMLLDCKKRALMMVKSDNPPVTKI